MKAPGEKLIYSWLFASPSSRAYLICLPFRVTHLPSNLCSYCALVTHPPQQQLVVNIPLIGIYGSFMSFAAVHQV